MYIPPDSNTVHDPLTGVQAPAWRSRGSAWIDPYEDCDGRDASQVAQDWASSWGELGYHDFPIRDYSQPDIRTYVFPSGVGRGWSGEQLLNGVSQLDPSMVVPRRIQYKDSRGKVVSGAAPLPYWQSSQSQSNPQQVNRFGGQAGEVPGPIQSDMWHNALYAGIPATGGATGGPGTLSAVAALRKKFGF